MNFYSQAKPSLQGVNGDGGNVQSERRPLVTEDDEAE